MTYEPVGTPPNEGHEGVIAWASAMAGFESVTMEVREIYVSGNSAAIVWTTTFGLPGDMEIELNGVDVHEYNADGLIQTVYGYFDPTPLMELMGAQQ